MADVVVNKFQYASGLVNPYASCTTIPTCDYYTTCSVLLNKPSDAPVPDDSVSLSSSSVSVSVMGRRACVEIECYPSVDVSFSQSVTDEGINSYDAHEWRWYFDTSHPDSFICFQLKKNAESSTDVLSRYCFVVDVCPASTYIPGGSVTCTFDTGITSLVLDVTVDATWA